MLLSIVSWGGIGDTLRNISLVPHEFLFRKFGVRSGVRYVHWSRTGALAHALPPEAQFFEEIVARCPSLRWCGETAHHRGVGRWVNRALREIIKLTNGGTPRYFPFEIPLSDSERAALPARTPGMQNVGIQTHLSGMKTKQWGIENWRAVIKALLEVNPKLSIFLFDADPQADELCIDARVRSTLGLNICQSIHLAGRCDFHVSVDSWTKYVAAWSRIPQLVIVPDQRAEYPDLTARKLVRDEFAGIYGNPANRIVGIAGALDDPTLALPSLAELSPRTLVRNIQECLGNAGINTGTTPP